MIQVILQRIFIDEPVVKTTYKPWHYEEQNENLDLTGADQVTQIARFVLSTEA